MKRTEQILLPAVTGTTLMTMFSYLVSELAKEDFSEPEHLSVMLKRLAPGMPKRWERVAGWGAHYAVGALFVSVYLELWKSGKLRANLTNGILLGGLSGLLAVAVWKATFKAHPLPPWINYRKYYIQLIPAHIVFAVVATITYRLMNLHKPPVSAYHGNFRYFTGELKK